MLKKYLIVIASCLIAFDNIRAEKTTIPLDEIIAKIEQAADPHSTGANVKTLITVIELSIPAQQIKMQITEKNKFPDKTKKTTEIPGVTSITNITNNDEAWEISQNGVRVITGKELEFIKFQLLMKNPAKKMTEVFKDIKLAEGDFTIEKQECVKLICSPKSELDFPPITMFFSKKDFLLRRMEMNIESPLGQVPVITTIEKYKLTLGRMIPVKIKNVQAGMLVESKLLSAKENVDIPDSEFENPTPVEVYK